MPPAPLKPPRPRARAADPALAGNLAEIALQGFEAGASVAYLIRDPQALFLRDERDQPLVTDPAATALVLLFPCRADGEPGIEELRPDDVRSPLG